MLKSFTLDNPIIKTDSDNKFLDVCDRKDLMRITDYSYMNKELVIIVEDGQKNYIVGEDKIKITIDTIDKMMLGANMFIEIALANLNWNNVVSEDISIESWDLIYNLETEQWEDIKVISPRRVELSVDYSITEDEKQLLAEQLVFDMLYDYYLNNSPKMTVGDYINNLKECHQTSLVTADRKTIQRGMEQYYRKLSTQEIKEQLEMLGIDADKYPQYYKYNGKRNVTKPKYIWDQLFYNKYMITARQYRRQFTKAGRNYPYWEIYRELYEYNQFIEEFLPNEKDYGDFYFYKAMDYFSLESYKRIDFMCKLAIELPEMDAEDLEFLIRRFTPEVLLPHIDEGMITYSKKINYYTPLFMIEDLLLKSLCNGHDATKVGEKLFRYQVIRAKAYELMKYHLKIGKIDFVEIEKFLRKSYDVWTYHSLNRMWTEIDGCDYKKKSDSEKKWIEDNIRRIIDINAKLFKKVKSASGKLYSIKPII